jgi:hypothetical protein
MQEYEVQAAGHDKKDCFHAPLTHYTPENGFYA